LGWVVSKALSSLFRPRSLALAFSLSFSLSLSLSGRKEIKDKKSLQIHDLPTLTWITVNPSTLSWITVMPIPIR
jgi:hypothetical protein